MGVVNFNLAASMQNTSIWYGYVYYSDSSEIWLSDGYNGGIYYGSNFRYSAGNLVGGTLTGYDSLINVNLYNLTYDLEYTARNFNLDAATAYNLIQSGNALGFDSWALSGSDTLNGSYYSDYLLGYSGNDLLTGGSGNDILDGGSGFDTANYISSSSQIYEIRKLKVGGYEIQTPEGLDRLYSIEQVHFSNGYYLPDALVSSQPIPSFAYSVGGVLQTASPIRYSGPVTFLEYQFLGGGAGDVVTGSSGNDFMNLLSGDDAASGQAGDDVLDGGLGSNFLSGGYGSDTFFLDGRGGGSTWSTITDFSSGDEINIWGWVNGLSRLLLQSSSDGAVGYTGQTYHFDLNNDLTIDTSITFAGINGTSLSMESKVVADNGYLFIS